MQLKRGERKVTAFRWREMIEQKAFRGKLWVACGMEQYVRRMREHFTVKKARANSKKGKKEHKAFGKRSGHTKSSWNWSGAAVI